MGFRFYQRIPLSRGTGINVSGSGFSVSHRGKHGSIGTKGFSIRTGVPGLSFKQSWPRFGKGGGLETLLTLLLFAVFIYLTYNLILLAVLAIYNVLAFVMLLVYNILVLIWNFFRFVYRHARMKALERKLERDIVTFDGDPKRGFVKFSLQSNYNSLTDIRYYLEDILIKEGEHGFEGQEVCTIRFESPSFPEHTPEQMSPLSLKNTGVIRWYKMPGQELVFGEYFASIQFD